MPGEYISIWNQTEIDEWDSCKEKMQRNAEYLFDQLIKRGAPSVSTSQDENLLSPVSSCVNICTPPRKRRLFSRSKSPEELRMPEPTRNNSFSQSDDEENNTPCEEHREMFLEPFHEDINPCSTDPYCPYYFPKSSIPKKSMSRKLAPNKTNKRLKLFSSPILPDKENMVHLLKPPIPSTGFFSNVLKNMRTATFDTLSELITRSPSPTKPYDNLSPVPPLIPNDDYRSYRYYPPISTRSRTNSVVRDSTIAPHDIGLRNIKNTCYVNATLQALFCLPGFTDDLVTSFEGVENLTRFTSSLIEMVTARKKSLSYEVDRINEELIMNLWTLHHSYSAVGEQQDANEFLVRLIEHLKLAIPDGPKNPVESHFECEMIQVVHCTGCGKEETRSQKQSSICLTLSKNSKTLEKCLDDYMAEEERELTCTSCQATTSKITSKFRTIPSKLIMSVNRFTRESKLAQHIVPPKTMDIQPFLENPESELPSVYTLTAQIVHMGADKNFGHYVSHVRCEDGAWRCYNDLSIHDITIEQEIQSVDCEPGYIYFYVHECKSKE